MAKKRRTRVTLAVADAELRRQMEELLEKANVEIDTVSGREELRRRLESDPDSLFVTSERLMLDPKSEEFPSSASVVAVSSDDDSARRAGLFAAGADDVVSTDDPDSDIAETIASVVDRRSGDESTFDAPQLSDFRSRAEGMREFLDLVNRIADSDSSLLVTGETGVGKEHLSRAIHVESSRASGPFVSVNCGALPEQLLESELFGHEAGAFTGAKEVRRGRFELAAGGTIFLDEIGEMPNHLQVRLLSVLERREITRLGGEKEIPVDVRVMAATNRDIESELESGRLRQDLYFRLNVIRLHIPPLRDRGEDLPELAGRFLREFRERVDRTDLRGFTTDTLRRFEEYEWPGNVRELVNVVERACLVSDGPRIGLRDLPAALGGSGRVESESSGDATTDGSILEGVLDLEIQDARKQVTERFEKIYLERLLERNAGRRLKDIAKQAGITRRALYDRLRKHDIDKNDFEA